MTVTTVFASTADGYVRSEDATYATAAANGGTNSATNNSELHVGQLIVSGTTYRLNTTYLVFDTSGIPDDDVVSAVELHLFGKQDSSTTNFDLIAKAFDWSDEDLTTDDWQNPTQLSALTTLASLNTSGISISAYNALTSAGAPFNAHINKTGNTYLLVASSQLISATAPTNDALVVFHSADVASTTNDPKLVITHAALVNTLLANAGSYAVTGSTAALVSSMNPVMAAGAGSYSTDVLGAILATSPDDLGNRFTVLRRAGDPLYAQIIIWSNFDLIHDTDPDQFERLEYVIGSTYTFRVHFRDLKTTIVTLASNPFAMSNGSAVVRVTHTAHGRRTGEYVRFTGAGTVGGIQVGGSAIYEYQITYVSDNSYDITQRSSVVIGSVKAATITVTIASPGVVTWTSNGIAANTSVVFTTTGALPTGITSGVTYYVKTVLGVSTFTISATIGGAAINTTGSQSGTHTATVIPAFSMSNGSAVVRVTHTGHGRSTGNNVFFSDASAVGGIQIRGNYTLTVIDANTYDITHSSAATSTASGGGSSITATYDVPATSTATGGGSSVVATYNEFQIVLDASFGYAAAEAQALLAAPPLGKLPRLYRQNLNKVFIHPGDGNLSAGEAQFTLYATRMATRIAYNNDLEESCFHEATHAAIEEFYQGKGIPYKDTAGWDAAVAADNAFIDDYATTNGSEDIAQSALVSYAMITHPERFPEPDRTLIAAQIPNRIAFFRDVVWIDPVTACVRVPAANVAGKLPAGWIASLVDNTALASHCRDLANLKVEAYYSRPDLVAAGVPDLYKFFCNVCGRAHPRHCSGNEPRPFWDVR